MANLLKRIPLPEEISLEEKRDAVLLFLLNERESGSNIIANITRQSHKSGKLLARERHGDRPPCAVPRAPLAAHFEVFERVSRVPPQGHMKGRSRKAPSGSERAEKGC